MKKNYVKCSSSSVCEILKSMKNFASCAFSPLALFRKTWFCTILRLRLHLFRCCTGAMYRAHIIHNFLLFFNWTASQRKKKSVISNFLIVIVSFFCAALYSIVAFLWFIYEIYASFSSPFYTASHLSTSPNNHIVGHSIDVCVYIFHYYHWTSVCRFFFLFLSTTRLAAGTNRLRMRRVSEDHYAF